MMRKTISVYFLMLLVMGQVWAQQKVQFPAADGLSVTADLYEVASKKPLVILCHQAGWSRGEYQETAKWINGLGFSCLALDQRSGEAVNGVRNATAAAAKAAHKGQDYLDALPDIEAACDWGMGKGYTGIVLVGSSYSASLVLKVAHDNQQVQAVAAFSPGEYFGSRLQLGKAIDGLDKPTFITASKSEMAGMKPLMAHIQPSALTQYMPTTDGHHGSRALWTTKAGYEGYRKAFSDWLGNR
jgi:dienelactone hydrolase